MHAQGVDMDAGLIQPLDRFCEGFRAWCEREQASMQAALGCRRSLRDCPMSGKDHTTIMKYLFGFCKRCLTTQLSFEMHVFHSKQSLFVEVSDFAQTEFLLPVHNGLRVPRDAQSSWDVALATTAVPAPAAPACPAAPAPNTRHAEVHPKQNFNYTKYKFRDPKSKFRHHFSVDIQL